MDHLLHGRVFHRHVLDATERQRRADHRFDAGLPGVTRRPSEPHTTVLEIDTRQTRIEAVIGAALALGGIEDVTVEDPPMEEVIHEIYAALDK